MIALTDHWVWDSWYTEHAGVHHAFYLKAPRSLGDPDRRHTHATIGHSISRDLLTWTTLEDALAPGRHTGFDDLAIWTGSIVRNDESWHMFYTGVEHATGTAVQRVGHAVSSDLLVWDRVSPQPVVTADARWYATAEDSERGEEPWRDPWVFRSPDDGLWHMLVTASDRASGAAANGSIGHCVSDDLYSWRATAPLTERSGFRQIEVTQVVQVGERYVLVFCAAASDVINAGVEAVTGTYTAPADSALGPFHLDRAEPVLAPEIYAGRVVTSHSGAPVLLGFVDSGVSGGFTGVICDPIPLVLTKRGTLQPLDSDGL